MQCPIVSLPGSDPNDKFVVSSPIRLGYVPYFPWFKTYKAGKVATRESIPTNLLFCGRCCYWTFFRCYHLSFLLIALTSFFPSVLSFVPLLLRMQIHCQHEFLHNIVILYYAVHRKHNNNARPTKTTNPSTRWLTSARVASPTVRSRWRTMRPARTVSRTSRGLPVRYGTMSYTTASTSALLPRSLPPPKNSRRFEIGTNMTDRKSVV